MTHSKMKLLPQAMLAALVISPLAFAQQAAQKVEKIEVTGSNIKRIETETTAPIQVITAEEIRQSGKQTVTEVLRELPMNAAGGLTELSGSGSFSAGAATASLRGLGSAATLVLLNGKRIAPYGLADPNFGQGAAINLNAIPLDVIERIEILKDGASAIYGSEAIAGVINIILKKDYKGGQVAVQGSSNRSGLYNTGTVSATFGMGDLAKDRYNVFGNVEIYRQQRVTFPDALPFLNRQEFKDVYGTGLVSSAFSPFLTYITNATGAVVASPGATCPQSNIVPWNFNGFNLTGAGGASGNVCLFDNISPQEIVPKVERESFFVRGNYDLSNTTSLYAEGSYVHSNTFFNGAPAVVGFGVGATFNPSTGTLNPGPTRLPIGHPNNPFNRETTFRGRFDAVGPQNNEVDSKSTRGVFGVKTLMGTFDVESSLLYNRSEQESTNYNSINYAELIKGITGGQFNFVSPNTGGVTANSLRINARDKATSTFTIFDVKGSGEIGKLQGGPIGVALGTEFRRESRTVRPDFNKTIGNIYGRGVATADGSRNVSTLFGEVNLPVVKSVEIQTALRYDRYSDYGSSTTPKVAASWAPLSELKFRGSYARGFRAPSLTEISKSAVSGFFNGVDDPKRCNRPTLTVGCGVSVTGLISANPGIQPEKAETYSGGFVFEPTKDASVSIDYFSVTRRNEIGFESITTVLLNEDSNDPRFKGKITRDPTNVDSRVPNDPGALQSVKLGFLNAGKTTVRGLDIDMRYAMSLGAWGKLSTGLNATYYLEQRGSGAPNDPQISFNGFRNSPDWRANFRTTWSTGNWVNTGVLNYVGKFKAFINPENGSGLAAIRDCGNPVNSYLAHCTVSEWVTLDVGTEYRGFKNVSLSLSVRNLTNERPQFDPLARPFNTIWYQPQGTNFIARAVYTFK